MPSTAYATPLPELAPGTQTHGFTVERVETLPELSGCAYVMRHDATRARLMWLACDDDNKSFGIAFKTPPADDTGVFHINEHSVLCGSDRFPVKEPFVNLLKTSMQTFLNAMTYADKTLYPVSSTNDQDLENLMDVYLDAVLHPAIYSRPRIFEQEGWHYEADEEGTLTRNGVVFNEMKGALSDPDDYLMMWLNRELFPDTAYGYESGGDPKAIPQLTYQDFIDANARHYRLDNSYTVLYGAVDLERMLAFIDERFRTAEDRGAGSPNPLEIQAPVRSLDVARTMSTTPENACVGLGYVFATAADRTRVLAMDVLLDALLGSNEAPLKRAILEAGLGDDCLAYLIDAQLQPYVFVELKGARPGAARDLLAVVERTCAELAEGGIERERLEGSIAQAEFNLREGDWGMSDGVALTSQALAGWLYDDEMATAYLRYERELDELRAMVDDGGFERLVREAFLENDHMACVTLDPAETTDAADESAELAGIAAELGEDGLRAVRAEVDALRLEQEAPDAPEDLAKLPQLHVGDIGDAPVRPEVVEAEAPLPCLAHELDTHHIAYAYHYFDLACLDWDELPYAALLALLLGKLGTSRHSAAELDTLMQRELGSLDFFCETYHPYGGGEPKPALVVGASALSEKVASLATLPREVWGETLFDDRERVAAILDQRRLELEQSMATAGHSWALSRVSSYTSRSSLAADQLGGVGFYRFLRDLIAHFGERADEVARTLADVSGRVFRAGNACVSFVGSGEDRARFWEAGGTLGLPSGAGERRLVVPEPTVRAEAFVVPANVCFVGRGAEGEPHGQPRLSGAWLVASRALSYDYLWNEVRVKGGAYGCGFRCTTNGRLQFYSYRDPAVDPTVGRFDAAASWLAEWDPSADELEGYVVSNVAKRDAPLKPRALARQQDVQRFSGITEAWRARVREEILSCTAHDVRKLAVPLQEARDEFATCVFGGRAQIEASDMGLEVVELFG